MKKIFLFGLVFTLILCSSFVSAQPFAQRNEGGFQIFHPEYEAVKQNEPFELHIHVSNITNGYPLTNDQATCYLHLYNSTGEHTMTSILELCPNGVDWEIDIDGGNFSDVGLHSFYLWCNNTEWSLGGEAKGFFEVTPDGRIPSTSRALTELGLGVFMVLLFLICLYGATHLEIKNTRNLEGNVIMVNWKKYSKIFLGFLSYLLFVWILNILIGISRVSLTSTLFFDFLKFVYIFLVTMLFPIFVILFAISIFLLFKDIRISKGLIRGLTIK